MNEMNYEALLSGLDAAYDNAEAQESGKLPDGKYNCILKEARLKENDKGLRLSISYIVTDGKYKGRLIFDSQRISEDSVGYLKAYLEKLAVQLARLSALPTALPMFAGRLVSLSLVARSTKPEYQNVYLDRYIGMGRIEDYQKSADEQEASGFTVVDDQEDLPFN